MAKITLKVEPRSISGRKVKQLRKKGLIPANIFGSKTASQNVQIDLKKFLSTFEKSGETSLVYVTIGDEGDERPVLITNIHRHPVSEDILHADLHQVNLKQKVTANVPLESINESLAVKDAGGVLVMSLNEIEVEALPTEIPDKFTVDLSLLKNIGDSITVASLKTNEGVEIKIEPETIIASVQEPEEEEVVAPTESAEEVETDKTPTEGGDQTKEDQPKDNDSKE